MLKKFIVIMMAVILTQSQAFGAVKPVEDVSVQTEYISEEEHLIRSNIKKMLGEDGLKAYITAEKTGDYIPFYRLQGKILPTCMVKEYMTNAKGTDIMKSRFGMPLTKSQKKEYQCFLAAGQKGVISYETLKICAASAGYGISGETDNSYLKGLDGIETYVAMLVTKKERLPVSARIFTDEDINI